MVPPLDPMTSPVKVIWPDGHTCFIGPWITLKFGMELGDCMCARASSFSLSRKPLSPHGSSEGHEMLQRNDKYYSIAGDSKNVFPKISDGECRFQRCNFYQNRSMAFFKTCTFVSDTIFCLLAIWLSHLFTRRQAFSSPTE